MQQVTTSPIMLIIVSALLTALTIVIGFVGVNFGKRIDANQLHADKKFTEVFEALKEYRTKELCNVLMAYHEKEDRSLKDQINGVAKMKRGDQNVDNKDNS